MPANRQVSQQSKDLMLRGIPLRSLDLAVTVVCVVCCVYDVCVVWGGGVYVVCVSGVVVYVCKYVYLWCVCPSMVVYMCWCVCVGV